MKPANLQVKGIDKRALILSGQTFGSLTAIEYAGSRNRCAYWICQCACGSRTVVRGAALRSMQTSSCGCSRIGRATNIKHGESRGGRASRVYRIWTNMKSRCSNPNFTTYKWYGAKGVKVCDRWQEFDNFLADMGEPPADMTLDRIDPCGNYEPSNCRRATRLEQARNKRKTSLGREWSDLATA